ncbi:unnamed protein product [Cylicostephanus goldi]|uniref:Phosphorylated adapter RNA export protein n=1 Tax=Cylicostephanus goldi TaxID=71465 RepID=A0A3P7MLV9_CYLGO|nr:unnamed protein product [Cylicostephanus goldi]
MGERDPRTVKSIVQACGMEKALALFEETRNVESHGGMMIENGQRRRTPGGVFITLFKLDSEISEDVKKRLFGETKAEARKMLKARKKGRINYAENVAKVAELMKKEKEKEKHKDEDTNLKPLPEAEQVLLAGVQPGDTHVFDDSDVAELMKKEKEKEKLKDEDATLKPLPEAEQVLLAGDQPGDTHVFDDGDVSMEA